MRDTALLAELQVADSRFLAFCKPIQNVTDANHLQNQLKSEHQDAAHVPVVWKLGEIDGYEEDGEPPGSVVSGVMEELKLQSNLAIVIVRYFGSRLLGYTCGRLPQCYQTVARLAIHRHVNGTSTSLERDLAKVSSNVYGMGAGDCELILDVVTDPRNDLLEQLMAELNFDGFRGAQGEVLPRLQNLQADLGNGFIPVYRYPGNYTGQEWETFAWSQASLRIKVAVEEALQPLVTQTMNHCVTNLYRDGADFIAHHSDKDLDLNRDGVIVSVSLGDERILELRRRQEPHDTTRILLRNGSMLVLGPFTNEQFSHSILAKEDCEKPRISLTLRDVKTFWDADTGRLFGQGVGVSLEGIRKRYLLENTTLFGGFCALSVWLVSNKGRMNHSIAAAGLFVAASWTLRFATAKYHAHMEQQSARDFFSSKSMSGTKY